MAAVTACASSPSSISSPRWAALLPGIGTRSSSSASSAASESAALRFSAPCTSRKLLPPNGAADWRWKLGIAAIPAAFFLAMLFGIPRSPRWLAKQSRIDEARQVLQLTGEENYEQELQDIVASIDAEHHQHDALFSWQYRLPIFLAVTIGMFNQLSGI